MTKETKDILLRLLQQHKELGISEQIDYQKHYLDSLINNSVALSDLSPKPIDSEMVDKQDLKQEIVDKWSIKPSLAEKLVDILDFVAEKDEFTTEQIVSHFGFNTTTAKRYLRNSPSLAIWRHMVEIRTEHIANSSSSGK